MPGGEEIEVMRAHARWQEWRSSRRLFSWQVGAAMRLRLGWVIRPGFGGGLLGFLILALATTMALWLRALTQARSRRSQ